MYEAFFNLHKKPFELVPDPDFIYLSQSHKRALTYLDYGIRERAGFILLTGDVGSGKTTLIRDLVNKRYEKVVVAKVFNTRVTSEQLLSMINDDFGLPVNGKDKVSLMHDLNNFLIEQYAAGNQPILIIDEAQNLDAVLLEEIRMLSNLESSHSKLLQIVLVGQPELRETLAAPALLQLRQRISINCHLKPLTREEVFEYVSYRMEVAGNETALVFPDAALDLVFQYSRGIPRLINIFCDFIMLAAFAEETNLVSLEMVHEVVGDLDFENHFWGTLPVSPADGIGLPLLSVSADPQLPAIAPPFFAELAKRLDSIERESALQVSILKKVCDALTMLRGEITAQMTANEAAASRLRGMVDSVGETLEHLEESQSLSHPADAGLARRLMAGITGGKGKKW